MNSPTPKTPLPSDAAHAVLAIYNLALMSLIAWGLWVTKTPWPLLALIIARPQLTLRIDKSKQATPPMPTPEELQAFISIQMLEKFLQTLDQEDTDLDD